jgi:hypothetical protein
VFRSSRSFSDPNKKTLLLETRESTAEASGKGSQVTPSASSSSQDQQAQQPPKSVIPTQCRVTEQLTKNWAPFKALRQHYAGTRFEEQRQLHLAQKHKATVADSTLRVRESVLLLVLLHIAPLAYFLRRLGTQ